ncbi:ribosome biogenesis protein NSA1 [Scheffersomyces coipomensis]|uniref:ribosome biogenesis protein NSA1 n=1 Tax=Scheffersomyces coipomensis TaxID=1788519 RepID=UPI00315C6C8D
MKLLVSSDDNGQVKEVIFNRGTDTSKKDGQQPISIKNFCTEPKVISKSRLINFSDKYLVAAKLGGSLNIYELPDEEIEMEDEEKYKLLHSYNLEVEKGDVPIALIANDELESIIVAYESSKVFIINLSNEDFNVDPILINLDINKPIAAFVENPYEHGTFAYGGKEVDVKIIRLFEKNVNHEIFSKKDYKKSFIPKELFKAKNAKNDHLDLRPQIWISQILFFKDQPTNGYKFITATRYGQIRLYDTTHGRRPIKDFKLCDKPIITLSFVNENESEIIVTDTHNLIAKHSLTLVDENAHKTISASAGVIIKPVAKLLGKFSEGGNTGATFGVASNGEILVTGGLDRYVRVFDIESRELLGKVYLGVEISSILIVDDEDEIEEADIVNEAPIIQKRKRRDIATEAKEESDEEDLWNELEINEKKSTKKQKTV